MGVFTCPTCDAEIPADSMHWLIGELVYCDEHGPAAQSVAAHAERPNGTPVQVGSAAALAALLRKRDEAVSVNA